jgi:hypothetical protein
LLRNPARRPDRHQYLKFFPIGIASIVTPCAGFLPSVSGYDMRSLTFMPVNIASKPNYFFRAARTWPAILGWSQGCERATIAPRRT